MTQIERYTGTVYLEGGTIRRPWLNARHKVNISLRSQWRGDDYLTALNVTMHLENEVRWEKPDTLWARILDYVLPKDYIQRAVLEVDGKWIHGWPMCGTSDLNYYLTERKISG